ncbi:MAG: Type 1 glutamine amidotransferase-like domain-containing protein [Nocardioidaceae bacterium]
MSRWRGSTLRGIEGAEDDPEVVPDGYQAAVVWEGLGLLPFAIAPHYGAEPGGAGSTSMADYYIEHHIPFVALRDGEALVVDEDATRTVGRASGPGLCEDVPAPGEARGRTEGEQ